MAALFFDGFDTYTSNDNNLIDLISPKWTIIKQSSLGILAKAGRYSGHSIQLNQNNKIAQEGILPAVGESICVGFNFYFTTDTNFSHVNLFSPEYVNNSTFVAHNLVTFDEGEIALNYKGVTSRQTTLLFSVATEAWINIEFVVTRTATNRLSVKTRLNGDESGAVVVNDVVIDPANDRIILSHGTSSPSCILIDDFYILEGETGLGESAAVETIFPSGSVVDNWETGASSLGEAINNVPTNSESMTTRTLGLAQEFDIPTLSHVILPTDAKLEVSSKAEDNLPMKFVANGIETGNISNTELYNTFSETIPVDTATVGVST